MPQSGDFAKSKPLLERGSHHEARWLLARAWEIRKESANLP